MTGQCICGTVSVTVQSKPNFINDCNCTLCRKSGGAWGYFPSSMVAVSGETSAYSRSDKAIPIVEVHSCKKCGTTTHFVLTEAYKKSNPEVDQFGVNMKIFELSELGDVEVRFPDGHGWSGTGPFGYRRDPIKLGQEDVW